MKEQETIHPFYAYYVAVAGLALRLSLFRMTLCHAVSDSLAAYLDDRVSPRGGLDGSPAALRLVVGPVVSLGLHLDLQLILAVLAGEGAVERGWR